MRSVLRLPLLLSGDLMSQSVNHRDARVLSQPIFPLRSKLDEDQSTVDHSHVIVAAQLRRQLVGADPEVRATMTSESLAEPSERLLKRLPPSLYFNPFVADDRVRSKLRRQHLEEPFSNLIIGGVEVETTSADAIPAFVRMRHGRIICDCATARGLARLP